MRNAIVVLGMCLLLLAGSAGAQAPYGAKLSFAAMSNITLYNTKGQKAYLKAPAGALRLFVMLSPECPLCKNYSLVLNKLHARWNKEVQLFGIIPGSTYSGTDIKQFALDYNVLFPLLIDKQKKLAGYLKATVTPEAVLMDKDGTVIYRGAIDDWVVELGKKKSEPQQHYLNEAITQHLAGQKVQLPATLAKGCLINEF